MRLSVAIPDSSLSDEATKMDKTRKVSVLARACAIFMVETIYVYREGGSREDGSLLATVLRYLETPQFLRKRLFPRMNDLKFAGVLHPLKIPSHVTPANPKRISAGDARDGIVVSVKGRRFVDVGVNRLMPYFGREQVGRRVTVRFREGYPGLSIKEIPKSEAGRYWGYSVRERASLHSLLAEWEGSAILTSRKGRNVTGDDVERCAQGGPVLAAFGSPDKGVHEILGSGMRKLQNARTLNFFPGQATETVRLEEALLGTLSVINAYSTGRRTP